jgi:RimJ/RimL family protein N-acetyltransferase
MAKINKKVFKLEKGILVIRSAMVSDAEKIMTMLQQTNDETDFLTRSSDEFSITLEAERSFIETKLKNPREIFILAFYNGELAGNLGFSCSHFKRYSHKGSFGIAIRKKFWGLGIGRKMLETLLEWADANGFVKISLEVDTLNTRAIRLYKSVGFSTEALLKMDRRMENNTFRDSYLMARFNPYYLKQQNPKGLYKKLIE